ncbi:lipoprotein [Pantoea osteomyelitidis]|uniref:LPS-assembly lipoprotein LptM n=1 Tax=Pantoea osteomyelitidis TaxID=3230026 RepID=A0ABW7PR39_9GAMM
MKRMICQLGMVLALASLVGCGLKGPLYFPPKDQPQQPKKQTASNSRDANAVSSNGNVNSMVTSKPSRQAN